MRTTVLDIETYPERHAAARCGFDLNSGFPPFLLHEIACVSLLSVDTRSGEFSFDISTLSREAMGERAIVSELEQVLARTNILLTYNGRGFDLPVLLARAAVAEEPAPNLRKFAMRTLPGCHHDLLEDVSPQGVPRVSLSTLCAAFSIPVKINTSGDQVSDLVAAGRWQDISDYCETDVIATWLASVMWNGDDIRPGRQAWEALAAWIIADQPKLAHLLPYSALPPSGRAGCALGNVMPPL